MAEPTQRVNRGASEYSIDQTNQWMRSQPWWSEYIRSIGQDPNNTHLSKTQAGQLMAIAQRNGVQVDQGAIEVDPAGNFNPRGHKLRNTLIALGGAAAVAAPFALPALIGGAGGAAGAGGMAGLMGSSAVVPSAALGATGGIAGIGGAAAATGAGLMGASSVVPSAALGATGGIGSAGATGGITSGLSAFQRLRGVADIAGGVGRAIGAAGQASAQNRGAQLSAQMDADQMRMAAARDQRTSEADTLKKLAQTSYLARGGANFQPSTPYSYSFAPQGASDSQRQAAGTLEAELMRRLQNPMQLSDYSANMRPGGMERFSNIAAPILSTIGAFARR